MFHVKHYITIYRDSIIYIYIHIITYHLDMTYIEYQSYIAYQTYIAYQLDMKTLAQERYFSFSYIERSFPIIYRRKNTYAKTTI